MSTTSGYPCPACGHPTTVAPQTVGYDDEGNFSSDGYVKSCRPCGKAYGLREDRSLAELVRTEPADGDIE